MCTFWFTSSMTWKFWNEDNLAFHVNLHLASTPLTRSVCIAVFPFVLKNFILHTHKRFVYLINRAKVKMHYFISFIFRLPSHFSSLIVPFLYLFFCIVQKKGWSAACKNCWDRQNTSSACFLCSFFLYKWMKRYKKCNAAKRSYKIIVQSIHPLLLLRPSCK